MILGNIKRRVRDWGLALPRREAERRLVGTGVSLSVAQKLLAGTYGPNPKQGLEEKIIRAMKKRAS